MREQLAQVAQEKIRDANQQQQANNEVLQSKDALIQDQKELI